MYTGEWLEWGGGGGGGVKMFSGTIRNELPSVDGIMFTIIGTRRSSVKNGAALPPSGMDGPPGIRRYSSNPHKQGTNAYSH